MCQHASKQMFSKPNVPGCPCVQMSLAALFLGAAMSSGCHQLHSTRRLEAESATLCLSTGTVCANQIVNHTTDLICNACWCTGTVHTACYSKWQRDNPAEMYTTDSAMACYELWAVISCTGIHHLFPMCTQWWPDRFLEGAHAATLVWIYCVRTDLVALSTLWTVQASDQWWGKWIWLSWLPFRLHGNVYGHFSWNVNKQCFY